MSPRQGDPFYSSVIFIMALESATYISDLNSSNPAATDQVAQADDHIRLVKAALKATFPNVAGAVSLSHTEINALDTRLDAVEADYVKKDGSVSMTGALNMGTQKITNVVDPTADQEAATKKYVDDRETATKAAKTDRVYNGSIDVSYNVTVSSSAPSGGNNGDVWYQV